MRGAVSGSVVSISNFPASQTISGTVTANPTGTQTIAGTVTANNTNLNRLVQDGEASNTFGVPIIYARVAGGALDYWNEVNQNSGLPVANQLNVGGDIVPFAISGTVTIGSALPAGTNRIGVVTIGGGTVTIGAGTAQIGSVTASISNSLTIGSLPALVAGTAQIGSVTASISNSAVTVYPAQGTAVTNSNFTSLTSSTSLVSAVVGRDVLTVFNEGAGNLFISPGATATTISYQVRLSAGDYWECPEGQRSLAHTAVFATAGTARITEVS